VSPSVQGGGGDGGGGGVWEDDWPTAESALERGWSSEPVPGWDKGMPPVQVGGICGDDLPVSVLGDWPVVPGGVEDGWSSDPGVGWEAS
jgi:hypothetical protein